MNEEILNDVRSQLQDHLKCLDERISELYRMGYVVNRADWLHEERVNCKTEIELWESVGEDTPAKC